MKVTTYNEFKMIVRTFAGGHFRLLVVVGPPGTGKTTVVKEGMNGSARWINASVSAFELHRDLWRHPDQVFVIDDVDNLCRDAAMVRLLKALCDSQETRTIRWLTATSLLGDGGDEDKPPREFETRSRLIIIANDWATVNRNVTALNDRGLLIQFEPSVEEIHRRAADWSDDHEIDEFIAQHLHLLGGRHSMRSYVQAAEYKSAGLDWRDMLVRSWEIDPKVACVVRLLADLSKTQEERAAIFRSEGHGCRRNYFNICKKVQHAGRKNGCTLVLRARPSAKVQAKLSRTPLDTTDYACW